MAADAVCAVDVGSTLIKAAVYDEHLESVGTARADFPARRCSGRAEADVELVWTAFASAVRAAVARAGRSTVRVAVSAQMAGLVLLDARGHALRPAILGVDQRGEPADVTDPRTGCPPAAIYPAGKLRWLAKHEPGRLGAARYVGGIKEYLLWRLTEAWVTDPASASATGLYDVFAHRWLGTLARRCGVDVAQLPAVGTPAREVGVAGTTAATECGLPDRAAVLVGLGDGPAANLSCGAVGPSRLCVSLGTTLVARFLVRSADLPTAPVPTFVQHVADDWYCAGVRFDSAGDGMLAPLGAPGRSVTFAELPSVLAPLLEHVRELHAVGGHQDAQLLVTLAETWGRPVCTTMPQDGTRGTAALVRLPELSGQLGSIAGQVQVTGEIACREGSRFA